MNDMTMAKFGMGASALRVEDQALITGHGQYTADVTPEGTLYAVVLRSPIAAGSFKINDIEAAKSAPGVHLVHDLCRHRRSAGPSPLPRRL